jgi:hypothetical protein
MIEPEREGDAGGDDLLAQLLGLNELPRLVG